MPRIEKSNIPWPPDWSGLDKDWDRSQQTPQDKSDGWQKRKTRNSNSNKTNTKQTWNFRVHPKTKFRDIQSWFPETCHHGTEPQATASALLWTGGIQPWLERCSECHVLTWTNFTSLVMLGCLFDDWKSESMSCFCHFMSFVSGLQKSIAGWALHHRTWCNLSWAKTANWQLKTGTNPLQTMQAVQAGSPSAPGTPWAIQTMAMEDMPTERNRIATLPTSALRQHIQEKYWKIMVERCKKMCKKH